MLNLKETIRSVQEPIYEAISSRSSLAEWLRSEALATNNVPILPLALFIIGGDNPESRLNYSSFTGELYWLDFYSRQITLWS